MFIIDCKVEKTKSAVSLRDLLVTMHAPDTEPPSRILEKTKLKKTLPGKKSLTFISRSLFYVKIEGYQETFRAAILLSLWTHFMCVRKYLEVFCGLHVIVLRIKTFQNVATSS